MKIKLGLFSEILDWVQAASKITSNPAERNIDGLMEVTSSIRFISYFLDLTVDSPKPVVMVGAMRAASDFDADGPRNLLNAVRTVLSPESAGKGTLVVLNGEIHGAHRYGYGYVD